MCFLFKALKYCIGVVIFILSAHQVKAESHFIPGYLITLANDTVRGLILYGNWKNNPSHVSFRATEESAIIKYDPMDIKAFGVSDEIYVSAMVEKESLLYSSGVSQYEYDLITEPDTVFLQTIFSGSKSLYYLRDETGLEQFYIRPDASFQLLIHKRYIKMKGEKRMYMENKTFLGQLIQYLNPCPHIQDSMQDVEYKSTSLGNLFLKYYLCKGEKVFFKKEIEKTIMDWGVLAGLSHTAFKVKGQGYYLDGVDFSTSDHISGGFFLDLIFARGHRRWSLNNELVFTNYKVTAYYEDNYEKSNIELAYGYIKLNNLLRYRISEGKVSPYINLGFSEGVAIQSNNDRYTESSFHPNMLLTAIEGTKGFELGLCLGAGVKYKRYSFEIRNEHSNGISDYVNIRTPVNRLYFYLGYKL
jgi:hypothetical protein